MRFNDFMSESEKYNTANRSDEKSQSKSQSQGNQQKLVQDRVFRHYQTIMIRVKRKETDKYEKFNIVLLVVFFFQ